MSVVRNALKHLFSFTISTAYVGKEKMKSMCFVLQLYRYRLAMPSKTALEMEKEFVIVGVL